LSAFGKADVARLLTEVSGFILHPDCACTKAEDVGEFAWAGLQGDGRLELVATVDVNGRAFFNALAIFWRDSSGRVTSQSLDGWMIRDLNAVIRDLNGDGRMELIIPTVLVSHSTGDTTTWPAVYRLEKGKYVEASRGFSSFYDREVLPKLTGKIEDTRSAIDKIAAPQRELDLQYKESLQGKLGDLLTERAKILRLVGGDPTAGLEDARTWMNSSNPDLLQDAAVTFKDMGGREDEARAAGEAYRAHSWGDHH
jgi:hypothetical protein